MLKVITGLLVMLATVSSVSQRAQAQPSDAAPAEAQPSTYAQAEALNDEGKAMIGRVDLAGAAAKFRQAIALIEDPRYVFNLCYALEKSGVLEEARRECQWVTTSRDRRLANKAATLLASIDRQIAERAARRPAAPTPAAPTPAAPTPASQTPAAGSTPVPPVVAPGTPIPQHLLPLSMQKRPLDTSIHYGVRVGLFLGHFAGEYEDAGNVAAPSIGIIARKALGKKLSLVGEAQYAGRGSIIYASNFDSIEIALRYLDISSGLQYALSNHFYAELGATLSVLLSGEDESFFDSEADFEVEPADFSADLSVGSSLGSFDLRFHYKHGLLDIADVDFFGENAGAVGDELNSRSYGFQLGYYF
jgi:hypothetical protein